ncbi:hypothetical protein A3B85_03225 [Candidatus Nomurabacteria bacterium RIFCSPHIGHO2_02_FULL_37_13]|uniref:isoleucine--tRNA ligase n=1 Tax=Candidatus Nomurabacteria bacterium RIFCSPHIGHO2_02_FULL_37_13 TaxID=1801750 RepID=A0A1F6W7J5_9BACT|nr:MAG: hypothetical protein A2640_00920 [Candidatus Nomurabacteria bacterium RIFCSPHIGHO2_01_FULL_36_23]OGI77746.1 MAG: hypothetical protein A3B85_03225 [Candidatus Nomurabacteria bacterium RIFCSPHIGHO2_02_FULL_37_13]
MIENEKNKKSDMAFREERVLEFWRENKIFEKSLEKESPKGEFIFYDGPATANAIPPLHSLVPRVFKDAIPRYKTMRGYHVRRKVGWDTHGLPVELQIEKKLGLKSKKEIEEYGIAAFNKLCKDSVWEFIGAWNKFTARSGYWIDFKNPYITYENPYIESIWNIVKKINDQGLLYKDYRVVPWCPRCGTVLSSHELAQGYEDVKDLSVYIKFKAKGQDNTYILAWTTTPWTLPGNVALAIGEKIEYVKIKVGNEILILAKARLPILTDPYEIIDEVKGKDLVGLEYEPLFPYLKEQIEQKGEKTDKAFKVYSANFVNTEEGTGIVHTAVMYGQDDFELGAKIGLPKYHLVNPEGKFIKGTGFLEDRFVKEKDENGKPTLDVDIIKYLTDKNLFLKKENYEHPYPHCWRCYTALIYYARDSWYIKMSDPKIKKQLISENKKINWEPAHIRDGRFGEWLREIKDWAISRERYWGTPLPVWINQNDEKLIIGSIDELRKYSQKSGNEYFVLRHGEAENIILNITTSNKSEYDKYHLTEKGKKEVLASAGNLKNKKIDLIISSPLIRTKETAEIIAEAIGFSKSDVIYDERLREVDTGDFRDRKNTEYHSFFFSLEEKFTKRPPNGENLTELRRRIMEFLYETEKKYQEKKILIVSHEYAVWMMFTGTFGWSNKQSAEEKSHKDDFIKTGEVLGLPFVPLPHDDNFELDLHRPYIDDIVLEKNNKEFYRTKEVMDVWFDSGTMPFAQDHYPFSARNELASGGDNQKSQKLLYPADFISEGIDQTRGWFYTLHAVGVLMGRGKAYKNVICLGHLLDAMGKKMSKSLGNIVDPWVMMDKYGVDTLRLWMYSINQPGESKNFNEKTVSLLHQQVFTLLYNVLAFYELYRDKELENNDRPKSKNILDQWILARLTELISESTKKMEDYKLLEPTRAIRDFIGDLSTWYLRRSRERIKEEATNPELEQAQYGARATLYFVLKNLTKVMAPLAPFAAEDIWLKLKNGNDTESVHLTKWPLAFARDLRSKVLRNMSEVRKIVSLGFEARQKAKIQVRQPLVKLEVKNFDLSQEYIELIKEELNVKEIKQNKNLNNDVILDVNITPELKQEGSYRELLRAIQNMRKKMELTPNDIILLTLDTNNEGKKLVQKFKSDMKKVVLASKIEFGENDGDEVKIDELVFKVKIDK